jgi:hypothetical protein
VAQRKDCGNEYDKTFEVVMLGGDSHTFGCFECATHALAPTSDNCRVSISGHGVQAGSSTAARIAPAKLGMAS